MKTKHIFFSIFCFCTILYSQGQSLVCDKYTSLGTMNGTYSVPQDPNCVLCGVGQNSAPWTGNDCSGTVVSTVNGGAVNELVLAYTSVNDVDTATIFIDGGGIMSIIGTHVEVNDSIIGPYNCNGTFGDVFIKVSSTQPFTTVTLLNTGCESGWVSQCPGDINFAGFDTTITMCEGDIDLDDLVTAADPWGYWQETGSSGQFNTSTAVFSTDGLVEDIYTFQYVVDSCGPLDKSIITVKLGIDTNCNPIDPPVPPIDTTITDYSPITAFSPNADGINDFLVISQIDTFPENNVIIVNRWGDVVYETNNYHNISNNWDGKYKSGKHAPVGTYFFIAVANEQKFKGWVQLVR